MKHGSVYTDLDGMTYDPDCCGPLEAAAKAGNIEMYVLARDHYPGTRLLEHELTGIKTIGYWNATKKQSWELGLHYNEGIEICFLEAGKLNFTTDDRAYELLPGMLTITRSWLRHNINKIDASRLYWFIIDVGIRFPHQEWKWPDWIILSKTDMNELTNILQRNEQPVWLADNAIKKRFIQIGNVISSKEEAHFDTKIKIYINEILILLLELFKTQDILLDEKLTSRKRSVELFINSMGSYISEPLTLKDMADYCDLGITQFSKYFIELTNLTPMKYLNSLRLQEAVKQMKEHSDKNIIDIAYDCGFTSNQYFTKVFKDRYGYPPHTFRRSLRNSQ